MTRLADNRRRRRLPEEQGYITVGDEPDDSAFFTKKYLFAVAFELRQPHLLTFKYWKQSRPDMSYSSLLEQCGPRCTSKDAHWPLISSLMNVAQTPRCAIDRARGAVICGKRGEAMGHRHTLQKRPLQRLRGAPAAAAHTQNSSGPGQ